MDFPQDASRIHSMQTGDDLPSDRWCHVQHVLRQGVPFCWVMGDQKKGAALGVGFEILQYSGFCVPVQAGEGFVENQDFSRCQHGPGHRHPTLHAAAQGADGGVKALPKAEGG